MIMSDHATKLNITWQRWPLALDYLGIYLLPYVDVDAWSEMDHPVQKSPTHRAREDEVIGQQSISAQPRAHKVEMKS